MNAKEWQRRVDDQLPFTLTTFSFNDIIRDLAILEEALEKIANHKHNSYDPISNSTYNIGCVDGHRCAAQIARDALEEIKEGKEI